MLTFFKRKIQLNQVFKHWSKTATFFMLILSAFFCFSCIENGMQIESMKIEKARNQAEILSYEALVINAPKGPESSSTGAASSRGPASVSMNSNIQGSMGRDPWGQPFHYLRKSVTESSIQKIEIVVWSAGPNGVFDYDPEISVMNKSDDIVYQHIQ